MSLSRPMPHGGATSFRARSQVCGRRRLARAGSASLSATSVLGLDRDGLLGHHDAVACDGMTIERPLAPESAFSGNGLPARGTVRPVVRHAVTRRRLEPPPAQRRSRFRSDGIAEVNAACHTRRWLAALNVQCHRCASSRRCTEYEAFTGDPHYAVSRAVHCERYMQYCALADDREDVHVSGERGTHRCAAVLRWRRPWRT